MCYRVFFHTLSCDVRPVVSDGEQFFVDSFASPMKCSCEQQQSNVFPLMPCENHKCCMVMDEVRPCPDVGTCEMLTSVHRYYQASPPPTSHQQELLKWHWMETIDKHIFPNGLPQFCELGATARESLFESIEIGREIVDSLDVLSRLSWSVSMLRSVHSIRHTERGCRSPNRLLNTDLNLVAAMEARVWRAEATLRKQVMDFKARRWLVLLDCANSVDFSSNLQMTSIPEMAEAENELNMAMEMLMDSISAVGANALAE
ncbi:hypothetical protein B0T10DRAFT_558382 [Thelonectria olida]|uniref:Uncharacterized protein n=1 Tax=Thelonectria olida TaxID=1576542 RepID=A0A9P9AVD1_9HYPO|nr:hypothetical protein B0T10DRAFT_558382 [Thelonectria olida]